LRLIGGPANCNVSFDDEAPPEDPPLDDEHAAAPSSGRVIATALIAPTTTGERRPLREGLRIVFSSTPGSG
jgi:hypothetical protein